MIRFEVKGIKELGRKLEKMQKAVKGFHGTKISVKVDDSEIFTQSFLQEYTNFVDYPDFQTKTTGLDLHKDVEFIKQNTKFTSYQEMIDTGMSEMDESVKARKMAEAKRKGTVILQRKIDEATSDS